MACMFVVCEILYPKIDVIVTFSFQALVSCDKALVHVGVQSRKRFLSISERILAGNKKDGCPVGVCEYMWRSKGNLSIGPRLPSLLIPGLCCSLMPTQAC